MRDDRRWRRWTAGAAGLAVLSVLALGRSSPVTGAATPTPTATRPRRRQRPRLPLHHRPRRRRRGPLSSPPWPAPGRDAAPIPLSDLRGVAPRARAAPPLTHRAGISRGPWNAERAERRLSGRGTTPGRSFPRRMERLACRSAGDAGCIAVGGLASSVQPPDGTWDVPRHANRREIPNDAATQRPARRSRPSLQPAADVDVAIAAAERRPNLYLETSAMPYPADERRGSAQAVPSVASTRRRKALGSMAG